MGAILDRFGVRAGFALNFVFCAIQYFVLSCTDSLPMLFLSKIPAAGVAGFLCAQTAVAKITPQGEARTVALGRLTTAYTVGGVVGPFLGGVLGSSGDYLLGARCAVVGSLLAAGLVFLLPAHMDGAEDPGAGGQKGATQQQQQQKKRKGETGGHEAEASWGAKASLILSLVGVYLGTKVATGIANNMARSSQPLILKDKLGFDEALMGTVMSAQFAFGGFANCFLLGPITKALGGKVSPVVRNCLIIMGCTYLAQSLLFAPSLSILPPGPAMGYVFIGFALFNSIFQFSLATSITSDTTCIVPSPLTGTLMGIEHSMFAVAGIVGPLAGTKVFAIGGISGLGLACGCVFLAAMLVWVWASKAGKLKSD